MIDLHFGSGSVYGYTARDKVCLSDDHCSDDFGFTSIIAQSGLDGLRCNGVIGMSPAEESASAGGDFFLDKLHETGTIDQRVFSLYINTAEDSSRITYGGFDLDKFAHENSQLNWHYLNQGYFWGN